MDSPENQLKVKELQEMITKGLLKIPDRQADVFVLAKIEGLKTEEIAEILQCSPQTVRVHLHRAVKQLAEELKDYLK